MSVLEKLKSYALSNKTPVVLPEGWDERTLKAASELINENLAEVIIIGDKDSISSSLNSLGAKKIPEIINPEHDKRFCDFVNSYYEKRKNKGETEESAAKALKNPLFFGAMLVEKGFANGCIAGASSTSSDVLHSALRVIGTSKGIKTVSSFMILETELKEYGDKGALFFADIAVNINPDSERLSDIAISTADSWKRFMDSPPRVAFLSFATKGSAEDESITKVRQAVNIAQSKRPDILFDGELQLDAAIVPSVGSRKAPESAVAGKANILIFPDLNSGNIGYKLTERFSKGASATGPVLQGLAKPVNDLSRGASYKDIVNTCLVTIYQSSNK